VALFGLTTEALAICAEAETARVSVRAHTKAGLRRTAQRCEHEHVIAAALAKGGVRAGRAAEEKVQHRRFAVDHASAPEDLERRHARAARGAQVYLRR